MRSRANSPGWGPPTAGTPLACRSAKPTELPPTIQHALLRLIVFSQSVAFLKMERIHLLPSLKKAMGFCSVVARFLKFRNYAALSVDGFLVERQLLLYKSKKLLMFGMSHWSAIAMVYSRSLCDSPKVVLKEF
jgi:hypothetical protein